MPGTVYREYKNPPAHKGLIARLCKSHYTDPKKKREAGL